MNFPDLGSILPWSNIAVDKSAPMDVQSTVISRIGNDDLEITEYKHKQSMDEIEGRDMIESTEKVSSRLHIGVVLRSVDQ
jgi:hypothetical protein